MHEHPTDPPTPLFSIRSGEAVREVTLHFEGRAITVPEGLSVAAALLLNGAPSFRSTAVSASPRAAYCMMGVCFDCLVEIDGLPGCQACLTPVREGMVVRRQQGASDLRLPAAGSIEAGDAGGG